MSTCVFDASAEATDADDEYYSFDEDFSCDDKSVEDYDYEVKPLPLLDKDLVEHPEESVINYCRRMKGSRGTTSDGCYCSDLSGSYDELSSSSYDDNKGDGGGEGSNDRSESEKDDWLNRRKARPTSARKRSLFQLYLKQDSSDDSSEAESISDPKPKKKRMIIYLDDDEDKEA